MHTDALYILIFTPILVFSVYFLFSSKFKLWSEGQRQAVTISGICFFSGALLKVFSLIAWTSKDLANAYREVVERTSMSLICVALGILVCIRIWRSEEKLGQDSQNE